MTYRSLAAAACLGWGAAVSTAAPTQAAEGAEVADETLIVFVQPGASPLAERFANNELADLEQLAADAGVAFEVVDVTAAGGAPAGVGITPLVAYQNHRGRSIYQGRYATLDRVKNFVRTSRFLPQGDEPLVREGLPVWDLGRAKVGAPVKVTPLAGVTPAGFDADTFAAEMRQMIGSADARFALHGRAELGRSDRLFYVDFYPYRSEDDKLYLSLALYSQFHCHDPVFTLLDGSLYGPWAQRADVFARGMRILAAEIERQLTESPIGDGFDVVPADAEALAWEALGLPLPPKPEGASAEDLAGIELGQEWVIDEGAQEERPAVQFAFPAPLDAYAGEATSVSGTLTLGQGLSIAAMRGRFIADPASVTMGEPDLDQAIHSTMLRVAEYPESSFVIESVETDFDKPEFGVVAAAVMRGTFTMKGNSIPLTVPASVEAFLGSDGKPRLSIDGSWQLRLLEPFGINGPPGDAPANDTLKFTCYLVFEAAD
ncbi:MAG: YceI family protein [Planctomycetota bacterium]